MDDSTQLGSSVTGGPKPLRRDMLALWGVVLFSLGYTGLIWLVGGRLEQVPHLPDQGASWYYWKLPEKTLWGQLTAWGFYLAHQFAMWGLIWYGQNRVKRYTTGLHPLNVIALAANAFFILLHLLQTHLWYDGLAQDVSIWSSQGSVIVLLIWVLLMENNRRGLFFGARLPLGQNLMRFARKYHGYFFAWAIIYTFWYHPAEALSGHLWGFFYTTLLMLQGALMFTRAHTNRYWTFTLEVVVLAHGTMVAVMQGGSMWPMFFFGFAGIFVMTQMHGLGLTRWIRGLILSAYLAAALWVYSGRGLENLHQITWIPVIDYLGVAVLAALFSFSLWLMRRLSTLRTPRSGGVE
ncbi:MAG: hypothetical protein JSV66_15545 [Trueperaceae bacterium]|nr:MAG: hypothetical protein JSV66_15545 [Trueperaceae bacterium]